MRAMGYAHKMENPPVSWITLAHLLRPQGRKGEILAELHTDFPDHFNSRAGLSLRRPNGSHEPVAVETHWLPVGRNAGRVVLKLQGVDTIEAAEKLSASDLVISAEDRLPLAGEDEQYIADLLDCAVTDHDRIVGVVEDVQFPTNANGARLEDATPLLVVKSATGEELLIPFAKEWIVSIDISAKRLAMRLPDGLLDINIVQNR